MSKDKAGIVTLNIKGRTALKFGVPSVTRDVRRLLEVAGPLTKDGHHYVVECDGDEQSLLMGIVQRLQSKHEARQLDRVQRSPVQLSLKKA